MTTARSLLVAIVTVVAATSALTAQTIDTAQLSARFSADMRQQVEQITKTKVLTWGPWTVHQLGQALFTREVTSGAKRWVAMFYGTLTNDAERKGWSVDDLSLHSVRELPNRSPVTFAVMDGCAPREWSCVRTISCGGKTSFLTSAQWHDGTYEPAIDRIVARPAKPTNPMVFVAEDGTAWSTSRRNGDSVWYVGRSVRYRSGIAGSKDVLLVGARSVEIDHGAVVVVLTAVPDDMAEAFPTTDVMVRQGTSVRLITPTADATLTMPATALDMTIQPQRITGRDRCHHLVQPDDAKKRVVWCVSTTTMKAQKGRCQHDR